MSAIQKLIERWREKVKLDPRKRIGKLVGRTRVIDAWIGYCDGRPYIYFNEHHQAEWCVFTNRKDARKACADVRKVRLCIAEIEK